MHAFIMLTITLLLVYLWITEDHSVKHHIADTVLFQRIEHKISKGKYITRFRFPCPGIEIYIGNIAGVFSLIHHIFCGRIILADHGPVCAHIILAYPAGDLFFIFAHRDKLVYHGRAGAGIAVTRSLLLIRFFHTGHIHTRFVIFKLDSRYSFVSLLILIYRSIPDSKILHEPFIIFHNKRIGIQHPCLILPSFALAIQKVFAFGIYKINIFHIFRSH